MVSTRKPESMMPAERDAETASIFARGAEGVLTHHGTAIHAHALVETTSGMITGHVDALGVSRGAVLLLPASVTLHGRGD